MQRSLKVTSSIGQFCLSFFLSFSTPVPWNPKISESVFRKFFGQKLQWLSSKVPPDLDQKFEKFKSADFQIALRCLVIRISMLMWWPRCWWRMLETICVSDKFETLMNDFLHWKNSNRTKKSHQLDDSATNIPKLSPSWSQQYTIVINITVFFIVRYWATLFIWWRNCFIVTTDR